MNSFIRFTALCTALVLTFSSCQSTPKGDSVLNPHAYRAKMNELKDEIVLDVRTPGEYEQGHIEGALNININDPSFAQQVARLDKNKPLMVYCLAGGRSASAAAELRNMGFTEVYDLEGGYMTWKNAGFKEKNEEPAAEGMSMEDYNKVLETDKLVLVDFYAEWCTPCKKMAPFLHEIKEDMSDHVVLQKIDADKNTLVAQQMNISALPTLYCIKTKKWYGTTWDISGKLNY